MAEPSHPYLLPQNIDAEESLLGALLIDSEAVFRVADFLRPEDFYKPNHQTVFQAILSLFEKKEPIDIVTLTNELRDVKRLDEIGGAAYLLSLINRTPSVHNVAQYGKIVREKKARRDLISLAQEIGRVAIEEERDSEELVDEIESKVFKIAERVYPLEFQHIGSLLDPALTRIEELHRAGGALRGVATGLPVLDEYLSGLQRSDLVVLAARPSLGKTSLALGIARHVAGELKKPVAIFSLEMSRDQIVDRLIAAEAGINLWRLRTGKLFFDGEVNELALISEAMDRLAQSRLYIDDSPNLTTLQIRSMTRKLKHQVGEIGLVVVDYLQLLRSYRRYDNRVQEVAEISRSLKALARELQVPLLAVSQLSRAPEQRTVQIPKLSDLRDSGSIEQDADVVLFIHRPRETGQNVPANQAEIIIAKHRNGPIGTVNLYFDADTVAFYQMEGDLQEIELH